MQSRNLMIATTNIDLHNIDEDALESAIIVVDGYNINGNIQSARVNTE